MSISPNAATLPQVAGQLYEIVRLVINHKEEANDPLYLDRCGTKGQGHSRHR